MIPFDLSVMLSIPLGQGLAHPVLYLDPGSGSYLIQLLLAGALGGLFMVKTYWQQIKQYVKNKFTKKTDADE